jgi:hypothetical protein
MISKALSTTCRPRRKHRFPGQKEQLKHYLFLVFPAQKNELNMMFMGSWQQKKDSFVLWIF